MGESDSKYKKVIGKFVPVCGGRLLFNRSGDWTVYMSIAMIALPLLILAVFGITNLARYLHWSLAVVLILLNVLSLFYLLRTWLTEPGILMKDPTCEDESLPQATARQRRVAGLMVSVKNSKSEYITKSLEVLPGLINDVNIEGRTLMHVACQFDKPDMVHLLLSFRPDLSIRDIFGLRAIHYCAFDNLKESFVALAAAENVTDTLELEAFRQRLVREVCSLVPQYDELRNVYCTEEGAEFASISAFYVQRGPVAVANGSVVATNETREAVTSDGAAGDAGDATATTAAKTEPAVATSPTTATTPATEPATTTTTTTTTTTATTTTTTTDPATTIPEASSPNALPTSYLCRHNGHLCPVRRCTFCHIYTPPRAFHCRLCETCVRNYDHHCPWVSNCVGLRNHRFFMGFLLTSEATSLLGTVLMVVFFVRLALTMLGEKGTIDPVDFVVASWPQILYFIVCLGIFPPMMNLVFYHMGISSHNMTTHEEISLPSRKERRKHPDRNYYPNSQGLCNNLHYTMCLSSIPSLVNLQEA